MLVKVGVIDGLELQGIVQLRFPFLQFPDQFYASESA